MFFWVLDTPLIFKRLTGKLSRSLFYDKTNSNIAQNLHVKNVTQTSLIKMLFLKGMSISILKVEKVIYWSYYFDNLNFMKEK